MKRILLTAALVLVASNAFAVITNSKHDFSATGGASTYGNAGTAGTQLCVYCHTPHNAINSALLWNRNAAAAVTVYDKSVSGTLNYTALSTIGTTSMLCLSCHDGSIAVDTFGANAGSNSITGSANLGSNLTNDHPIGFSYATATVDTDIQNLAALPTFVNGTTTDSMECATCHDVHAKQGVAAKFLRIDNAGSALCLNCHAK